MLHELLGVQDGDAEGILSRAAQLVAEALRADKVDVFLHDPARDALVALGVSDTPMGRREHELGLDRLPLAEAAQLAEVYRTGTPFRSGESDVSLGAASERLGVRSSLIVPLEIAGERRGVLAAASSRPGAFDAGDLRLLDLLARVTALLIEHAQLAVTRADAARLAELDRLRREFINTISHTLQTPLTTIRAGLALLAASAPDRLTPDERGLLDTVRDNVEFLRRLIADLLTEGQIETGTLQLAREPFDLREPVREAVADIRPLLRERGQTVAVRLPHPLPVVGDRRRLKQVVLNLLGNVHQHTPAGTRVTVSGRVSADEVRLVVRDTGPGIPREELQTVFQRGYRRDPATPGSGLGLSIARGLVEMQGGRLWAEQPAGGGVAFHISLPRG